MVALDADTLTVPEADPVPKKQTSSKDDRGRARDTREVVGLGVEVAANIYDALQNCCRAKKWSKRTTVEEALTKYLTSEGFPP